MLKTILSDSILPAGSYTFTWRNDTIPPGTYFAVFTINGIRQNQTFVCNWSAASGVENANGNVELGLSPNPAKDKLYFNNELIGCSIALYDMTGKEYLVKVNLNEIDISPLTSGEYVLYFKDKGARPFIKE